MKKGPDRFIFYLRIITDFLDIAGKQNDPATWLFINNARHPFFMLEGLSKVYAGMHNSKKIDKLKDHFKLVEDGLGQIDYYNALILAFSNNKKIPAGCKKYLKSMLALRTAQLNKILFENDWLGNDNVRIKKITKKLDECDWLSPEKEVEAISVFYKSAVAGIYKFISNTGYSFDNVEEDVHELRRKLRWLSIYPQAMQGVIQYATETKTPEHLEKYLTPEVINSVFNKLPDRGENTSFFLLNKPQFLALSWMIAKLGELKDEGLILTGLSEAIEQSTGCTVEEAHDKAYNLLGNKQRIMKNILDDAGSITKKYFEEENLHYLCVGIVSPV